MPDLSDAQRRQMRARRTTGPNLPELIKRGMKLRGKIEKGLGMAAGAPKKAQAAPAKPAGHPNQRYHDAVRRADEAIKRFKR